MNWKPHTTFGDPAIQRTVLTIGLIEERRTVTNDGKNILLSNEELMIMKSLGPIISLGLQVQGP